MELNNKKFENELGYQSTVLTSLFKKFKSGRAEYENTWKLIQAVCDGKFWKLFKKYAPSFAITPDTNIMEYIVNNYTNSLYVGRYTPIVFPRSGNDSGVAMSMNEFLEYQLDKINFTSLQKRIGESAAKFNLGAIEIGWKNDIINGPESKFIGEIEAKQIDVMSLYLDPASKDYLKGRAIFIEENTPVIEVRNEPRLHDRMEEYLAKLKADNGVGFNSDSAHYIGQKQLSSEDGSVKLITCYYKHMTSNNSKYRIDKIWMIDNGFILDVQKDIKPSTFPVRVLYCRDCVHDPYGVAITKLILNNYLTINLLDCADSTLLGNSIKRPKVLSRNSGINEKLFAEKGDDPNMLWVCNDRPDDVIRYIDLPKLPNDRYMLRQNLLTSIAKVTGVDDVYTGRDTNSVQTTGGMDILNQRVGMSDNSRIINLQDFIISVSDLIMEFYLSNGGKNINFPKYGDDGMTRELISVDFEQLRAEDVHFDFTLNVSASTPLNIHKLAEKADVLLEKQMQYNTQPPVMTVEEWLKYQDIPQKYHILRRIQDERLRDDVEDIQSEIVNYAGMVNEGMNPNSAVNQLAQERKLKRDMPGLGNVGSGSVQAKQQG